MAFATRYLATVSTSLSPDFVVNNFMRDIQMAMINIAGEKSTDVVKRVGKRAEIGRASCRERV